MLRDKLDVLLHDSASEWKLAALLSKANLPEHQVRSCVCQLGAFQKVFVDKTVAVVFFSVVSEI